MISMLNTWSFSLFCRWYVSIYHFTCNIRGISFHTPVIPSATVLSFLVERRMGRGVARVHWPNFGWNYTRLMEEILHDLGCIKPWNSWDKVPIIYDLYLPRSVDTILAHWNCCTASVSAYFRWETFLRCFFLLCVPLKQCPKRSRCVFLVKLISLVMFWTVEIQFRTAAWLNLNFFGWDGNRWPKSGVQFESKHVFFQG